MSNPIQFRRGTGQPASPMLFAPGEPAWDATNNVLYVRNGGTTEGTAAMAPVTPVRRIQSLGSRQGTTTLSSFFGVLADRYDNILTATVTGLTTFVLPAVAAPNSFTIIVRQDATGGREFSFVPSEASPNIPTVLWPSGDRPVFPTGGNRFVALRFVSDGTTWYAWVLNPPDNMPASLFQL